MSHFSTVQLQFKSKFHILQALDELGLVYINSPTKLMNGYQKNNNVNPVVDIVVRANAISDRSKTDLGFQWNSKYDGYDLIYDSYDLNHVGKSSLIQKLQTAYVKAVAVSAGYNVNVTENHNDQTVKLVLTK